MRGASRESANPRELAGMRKANGFFWNFGKICFICAFLASWGIFWPVPGSAAQAAEPELEALRRPGSLPEEAESAGAPVRDLAMREAALGSAIQAGALWRYQRILREAVLPNASILDELFDFEPLVGRKGRLVIVPPVITSSGEAIRLEGDLSASSQGASYRLARGGRMATAVPHWRHYLMELPEGPKGVHPTLLPGSSSELGKWRGWVDKGWETGVRRAEALFEENVATLSRDYAGMMLFRRLMAEKLASGPVTAEILSSMEISDDEIVFERRIYRLTETGRFVDMGARRQD